MFSHVSCGPFAVFANDVDLILNRYIFALCTQNKKFAHDFHEELMSDADIGFSKSGVIVGNCLVDLMANSTSKWLASAIHISCVF